MNAFMRKRRLFCLLALFLYAACGFAAEEIPQPSGRVNDFANVITQDYHQKLNALIQELEEKTSAEIAVVTIKSIAPYSEEEFARLLFDNWKPGKKGKDNGVLVLVAISERRWRIEVGYGVEGILPDGLCGEIGRKYMIPSLRQGKYGEGLYYGVLEISRIIAENSHVEMSNLKTARPKGFDDTSIPVKFILPVFSLVFFLIWNIPWPIFIGLPFTLAFAFAFSRFWFGIFPVLGYIGAMLIRYSIWKGIPLSKRKSFCWFIIFGLYVLPSGNYRNSRWGGFSSGGPGGGGFSGGGSGGFGGGGGGGGGAGGRF